MMTDTYEAAAQLPPTELALTVPKEVSALASGVSQHVALAKEFLVDSEAAFQVADEVQAQLKAEAKEINEKRLEFTRPIDVIKTKWMNFFKPAIDGRNEAATIYQQKMTTYRRAELAKAQEAQRESERLLREERQRLEAEARKKEEHAQTLKNAKAKQRLLDEAEQSRQTAAMVPETVALSAPEPQTVASNVATIWKTEIVSVTEFLQWVITRPEWLSCVTFKDAEMNRLARQCRDALKVPGVRFVAEDSYRTKAGRR